MNEVKIKPNLEMKLANMVNPIGTFFKKKDQNTRFIRQGNVFKDQTESSIFGGGKGNLLYIYIYIYVRKFLGPTM